MLVWPYYSPQACNRSRTSPNAAHVSAASVYNIYLVGCPMQRPRANHYVPQFYLGGFADPQRSAGSKKRRLWVYERGKSPRLSTPENEAFENDFYAFEDVFGERHSIEGQISQIESRAAPVLRKSSDPDHLFSERERYEMSLFVSLMFVRGQMGRELISRSLGLAMKKQLQQMADNGPHFKGLWERRRKGAAGPSSEEARDFILGGDYEVLQKDVGFNLRIMVEAWDHLSPILFCMGWQILHTQGPESFVASDNPVISLIPEKYGRAGFGTGFAWPNTEVYFPLHARACLRMGERVLESTADVRAAQVRQINRGVALSARRFLFASERSQKLAAMFDKVGCKLTYGVNAFVHPNEIALREAPTTRAGSHGQ